LTDAAERGSPYPGCTEVTETLVPPAALPPWAKMPCLAIQSKVSRPAEAATLMVQWRAQRTSALRPRSKD